jgi:Fic family protein
MQNQRLLNWIQKNLITHRLIEEIFSNPVLSISSLSKKWGIPFNSVKTGVLRLVSLNILREETGRKRNKLYIASELIELLSESGERRF